MAFNIMKTRIIKNKSKGFIIPQVSDKFIIDGEEYLAINNPILDCDRCSLNGDNKCMLFLCNIHKVSLIPSKIKL